MDCIRERKIHKEKEREKKTVFWRERKRDREKKVSE